MITALTIELLTESVTIIALTDSIYWSKCLLLNQKVRTITASTTELQIESVSNQSETICINSLTEQLAHRINYCINN